MEFVCLRIEITIRGDICMRRASGDDPHTVTLHHTIVYHSIVYHIIAYYNMIYHIMSYHFMSYHCSPATQLRG